MKYFAINLLLLSFSGVFGVKAQCNVEESSFAFVNFTIIPMTDTVSVLTEHTIIVDEGIIVDIGPRSTTPVPDKAYLIEGDGRYIIPGLADMHAHILKREDAILELANGVTTIRNMNGEPWHISFRDSILNRQARIFDTKISSPHIYTSGPIMNFFGHPFFRTTPIEDLEDAINSLNQQEGIGYDFFKVYTFLTPNVFNFIEDYSNNSGIPFAGHGNNWLGSLEVIQSRQSSIEHFWGYLPNEDVDQDQVALENATVENGVWNCPTLLVRYNVERLDSLRANEPDEVRYFCELLNNWRDSEARPQENANYSGFSELLYRLYHNGGNLMLGTDNITPYAVAGFAVHKELELYVKAGLTPHQALTLATSKPHEYLEEVGYGNHAGTLEVGKNADLLILGGNPVIDINNTNLIEGVMANHNYYSKSCLQELLNEMICENDSTITGLEYPIHQHAERLKVYPNPVSSQIRIEGFPENESGILNVIDSQGKIIVVRDFQQRIALQIPNGVYLIVVESVDSGILYFAKIVKI